MRRATQARSCTGKKRHLTVRTAEGHRDRLIRRGAHPTAIEVYRCGHGPHYHVGHVPNRRREWRAL